MAAAIGAQAALAVSEAPVASQGPQQNTHAATRCRGRVDTCAAVRSARSRSWSLCLCLRWLRRRLVPAGALSPGATTPLRPRKRPLLGPSNPLRPSRSRSAPNRSSCPRSISKLTSHLRTCCNFRNLASQPCNFASIGGTQLCTARFLANVQPEGSVSNTSRTRTKPARAVTSFSSLRKFALPHGNLCQTQTLLNYPRVKVQGQGWVPDHCWAGGFKVANGPASKQNVSSPRVNDFFTRFRGESWGTLKDLPP